MLTHQKLQRSDARPPVRERASNTRESTGIGTARIAQLHRTAGNGAAASLLHGEIAGFQPASRTRLSQKENEWPMADTRPLPIQRKLEIGSTDDPLEREADQVAERVMRMPAHGSPAASSFGNGSAASTSAGIAPPIVHDVLASPGRPLDAESRAYFEPRIGADLSNVRLHNDTKAAESAKQVNAKAYAVGHHIALGNGQPSEHSPAGRRLLAHELAHVVQQNGTATRVRRSPAPADSFGSVGDTILEGSLKVLPPPLPLVAAGSIRGFVSEMRSNLSGNKEAIESRLSELLHWGTLKSLLGGFQVGIFAGVFSPITALWDMLVFADRMRALVFEQISRGAASIYSTLVEEGTKLWQTMSQSVVEIKEGLSKLKSNAKQFLIDMLTSDASGNLEQLGNRAGHEAAKSIATSIASQLGEGEKESSPRQDDSVLGQADAKIESVKQSLVSTPWSKAGYAMGYGVGAAAISILMIVFSGGIGNLIIKVGEALGELGGLLGKAGELVAFLGRAIKFVEDAIAAVVNIALKPLKPILSALEKPLHGLSEFLKKFAGLAEKEVTVETQALAPHKPPVPTPHSTAPPAPHVTHHEGPPAVKPHPAVSEPAPRRTAPQAPHVESRAPTSPHHEASQGRAPGPEPAPSPKVKAAPKGPDGSRVHSDQHVPSRGPAAPRAEKPGDVTVTPAAEAQAAKGKQEAAKLAKLKETAEELKARGYKVTVHGEGVTGKAGELEITGKPVGENVKVESKRLEKATPRAVQNAIATGTQQVGDGGTVLIDGTKAGVSTDSFQKGLDSFKRTSLPSRLKKGVRGSTGRIIFLNSDGQKIIDF